MALADGTNFGPYRILGRLGRGGMATVYRAYEPGLDRYVALKVLPEDLLENDTALQRFTLEARAVARLVHPNIVPVHAFGIEEATRTPWMALQLIEGGSLADVLAPGGLGQRRAVGFLRGIASALDYAHGQGILHRDVKPQNVLVAAGDHVYLADFGLARILESSAVLSVAGTVMGTPQYMAPEQALGQDLDHRCDIYALGIVAYEMLAGAPPFQADTPLAVLMKHVREPVPIPSPERVAEALLRPVLKALAKDRHDRWATALSFVEALDGGVAQTRAEQPTPAASTVVPARAGMSRGPTRPTGAETSPPIAPEPPSRAVPTAFAAVALVITVGAAIVLAIVLLMRAGRAVPAVVPSLKTFDDGPYAWVPAGAFRMGCTPGDSECTEDESPRHWVTLTRGYYMARTEVTVAQYRRSGRPMPPAPGFSQGEDHPIVNVTWNEADAYCKAIGGRLPTEAEWERAARGGHDEWRYTWGNHNVNYDWGHSISHDYVNYEGQSGKDQWVNTASVGQFAPNDYGLLDMLGNVFEWTADSHRGTHRPKWRIPEEAAALGSSGAVRGSVFRLVCGCRAAISTFRPTGSTTQAVGVSGTLSLDPFPLFP